MIKLIIVVTLLIPSSLSSHLYMSRSLDESRSLALDSSVDRNKVFESSADLDKDTLEKLKHGLYLFSSSGPKINDVIKSGEDVSVYCVAKINRRSTCLAFGSCPNMKFEWNFPLSLSESIKTSKYSSSSRPYSLKSSSTRNHLRDVRIYIDDDPIIHLHSPDDEIHISTMTIESIGSIHDGKWLCNFKYFDELNEKMDRNFLQFQLNVESRNEDQDCEYDDHCSSNNCIEGKCVCSVDYPIYDKNSGDCYVPSSLGAECEIDGQCNEGSYCVYDPKCSTENYVSDSKSTTTSTTESSVRYLRNRNCPKTCQCKDKLIPISLAFNLTVCQHTSYMKSPCESTDQCELTDPNTFCGFNNICECKEGRRCREPVPILCSSDDDCSSDQFCRYNRCVSRKRIGQSCSAKEECQKSDLNTLCLQNKCRCADGYKPMAASSTVAMSVMRSSDSNYVTQCIKEDSCFSHADCYDDHFCNNKKCIEGTKLESKCKSMIECKAKDPNSICNYETTTGDKALELSPYFWGSPSADTTPEISGVCTCRPRFKPSSTLPITCVADGHCINDNDCPVDSHCADGKCFDEVGSSCRTSERCIALTKFSYCDRSTKKCECDSNYFLDTLNGTCEPKECMTRIDCKRKDCINGLCSCPADKDTNDYGYCVDKELNKEPSDDSDMRGEYSFWSDLKRIFSDWTWEAYVIIGGVSFILILMVLICVVIIRLIMIKRQMRRDKEEANPATVEPLNSEAVTDYVDN